MIWFMIAVSLHYTKYECKYVGNCRKLVNHASKILIEVKHISNKNAGLSCRLNMSYLMGYGSTQL